MIALLIVAHGNLGDSLIQCATYVLGGRPEALENLDLSSCREPAEMLAQAQARLDEVDRGDGGGGVDRGGRGVAAGDGHRRDHDHGAEVGHVDEWSRRRAAFTPA